MKALVIGSGDRVKAELARVVRNAFDLVVGINSAAVDFGPVDYQCSLHIGEYAQNKVAPFVAHKQAKWVDHVHPYKWASGGKSGSSGLLGTKWALHCGADEVVLAGIGLDYAPHYNRPAIWDAARVFRPAWIDSLPYLAGKVFSLGGWTAELLNSKYDGGTSWLA